MENIVIKIGRSRMFLDPDRIEWIKAEGNHSRIFIQGKSYLMRQTMLVLEKTLAAKKIVRISRSIMVNSHHIKELQVLPGHSYNIVLHNGQKWICQSPFHLRIIEFLAGHMSLQ